MLHLFLTIDPHVLFAGDVIIKPWFTLQLLAEYYLHVLCFFGREL